ncbi:MAG TPA: CoA transferase [Dehalococcoidia bacterium]|nr:CoA transferase [Dehalococcoidia bacterium]
MPSSDGLSDASNGAADAATGPLKGTRVLEFSQIVAGPVSGIYLSDLGADVVKVEPPGGESRRNTGAVVPNEGKYFQSLNRGKRSLVVDLQQPQGRELIHRIIPGFDIVTINYRVGVAKRLEIDYETLSQIRPDLIYVEITGFGDEGPEAGRPGSDIVAQGYSGMMAAEGKSDEHGAPQLISSSPYADHASALAAGMGVSAALFHRERSGEGQLIKVSLLQTALQLLARHVAREPIHDQATRDPMIESIEQMRGDGASYEELVEQRRTHLQAWATHRLYYGGYNTADGAVVLGALTKPNRDGARRVLGIEDEPSDSPDFDALDPATQEATLQWRARVEQTMLTRGAEEWVAAFDAAGVPATVVHFPEQMADDPQVQAMGMTVELDHEVTGPQRFVGPILRMSKTPPNATLAAPALGSDSDAVLRQGGFSDQEIEELRASGVLG